MSDILLKSKFENKESYMHKCAKDILKEWLEEGDSIQGSGLGDIFFKPNRKSGVWLEYPVLNFGSYSSLEQNWDEIWACNDDGTFIDCNDFVPTYNQCVERYGIYPIAVIDIVCTHKGIPLFGIEICHKNPVSKEKIKKIKDIIPPGNEFTLIEIDATWIMSQINRPKKLVYTLLT